jgi:hypothetical protein
VQPLKHDQYERFILTAYPYYASALSTLLAFFVAGFAFLYSKCGPSSLQRTLVVRHLQSSRRRMQTPWSGCKLLLFATAEGRPRCNQTSQDWWSNSQQ